MKKHSVIKVVLITLLLFMLLTWIFPAAVFSGEYAEQGRVQMGLFDLFSYPLASLSYFGYIGLFLVLVGGFYGILYKIPAYRSFLDRLVKKVSGKEKVVLAVIMILFAVLTSICGLQIGLAVFVPFVVSLILLMGYDKVVAALTTVGSICVGLAGTTYAYNNISLILSSLSLDLDFEIGIRFVILVLGLILLMFNVFMYIKKDKTKKGGKLEKKSIKKVEVEEEVIEVSKKGNGKKVETSKAAKTSKTKSSTKKGKTSKNNNKAALKDDDIIVVKESVSLDETEGYVPTVVNKKHKVWPFVVGFLLLFILLVLAFIPWGEYGFGVKFFTELTDNAQKFELFGFPIFAKLLGTVNAFGEWSITDMILPLGILVLIFALIYKVKINDIFDGFANGAKKAIGPAFVVLLIYTILVTVTYHPFQLVIYKTILGFSKGFNIATTSLVAMLSSLFNADSSYAFSSVLPYYMSVVTNSDNYTIVGVMFQSLYGFTMLIAPTSVVLMTVLSYLKVSYKEWLKNAWKFLLEFLAVLLILFIILALI